MNSAEAHLVVVGLRIAGLLAGELYFGQSRLDLHDGFLGAFGTGLVEAGQQEQFLDVFPVGFLDAEGVFIGLQVVVAVAHVGAALIKVDDVHRAVLGIGSDVLSEESPDTIATQRSDGFSEGLLVLDGFDGSDVRFQRLGTQGIATGGVHLHAVDVGDLLGNGTRFVGLGSQGIDQAFELFAVVFGQLVERTETGVFRLEGVVGDPASAGVLVKVLAGSDRGVQIGHVQSLSRLGLGGTSGGERHHEHGCRKDERIFHIF